MAELIAYNLGNLWRRLALPKGIGNWSLTSLQQRLVKTGGRLVKQARYYWLLLAESHLTRRLFAGLLRKVTALPVPADSGLLGGRDSCLRKQQARDQCVKNPFPREPMWAREAV